MFKDTKKGQTHFYGDGCIEHSDKFPKTLKEEISSIIAKSFKEKFDSMLDDGSVYFRGSEEYADQIIQSLLNRLPKVNERSRYWQKLVDILEKQFPKGKCKERGQALVLLAYAEMFLKEQEKELTEIITGEEIKEK